MEFSQWQNQANFLTLLLVLRSISLLVVVVGLWIPEMVLFTLLAKYVWTLVRMCCWLLLSGVLLLYISSDGNKIIWKIIYLNREYWDKLLFQGSFAIISIDRDSNSRSRDIFRQPLCPHNCDKYLSLVMQCPIFDFSQIQTHFLQVLDSNTFTTQPRNEQLPSD